MEGDIYESSHPDYSYTSFTGYLVAPIDQNFRPGRRGDYYGSNDQCCCSRVCPVEPKRPPFPAPPSYQPPTYQPQAPTFSTRPPFIFTTTGTLPTYYRPVNNGYGSPTPSTFPIIAPPGPQPPPLPPVGPSIILGRGDNSNDHIQNCCDAILVSASKTGPAFDLQNEKLGVYRRQYVRSSDNRGVYKHCERDVYLFHYKKSGWSGWLIGPTVGEGHGGLLTRSDERCVERSSQNWLYYDKISFEPDGSVLVSCFKEGYLDGE